MSDATLRMDSVTSLDSVVSVDSVLQERLNADYGTPDTSQNYLTSSSLSPVSANGSCSGIVEYPQNYYIDQYLHSLDRNRVEDARIVGSGGSLEGTEGGIRQHSDLFETNLHHSFDVETDPSIWLPPDPEDMEDGVEGNMANYNDDDEYSNGTGWGQASPLSRLCEDGSARVKEEFQKEMKLVKNGKFKKLVVQLLQSEGIVISKHPDENWADIVSSLAWEAALFVMADTGGEVIDQKGILKVKCVATGSCSQSTLIKGLVFKKNAAHKHMLTKHKNPKLLLLEGMLGHSPSGLSSIDSVEQEKDNLKSRIEMIEMCHPNVVLVENTVSRDVQESFVTRGITLVSDMKPQRLERIAKYAESKIFSADDDLMSQKLKQCESFYLEKVVEEHVLLKDGAKKPVKTLMFLEGFNRPLGCTILLKGTHCDELKKIKFVIHSAFVEAYHLILETSFLVDQRATFSSSHFMVVDEFPKDQLPIVGPPVCEATTCNFNMEMEQNSALLGFISDISSNEMENGQGLFTQHTMSDDSSCYKETTPCEAVPTAFPRKLFSSLSASLKEVIGDSIPRVSSAAHQFFSTNLGYNSNKPDSQNKSSSPLHLPSEGPTSSFIEVKDSPNIVESPDDESPGFFSTCIEVPVQLHEADIGNGEDGVFIKDDCSIALDSQTVLYMVSSRSASKRTICEESRLHRVNYYDFKNFDVSLGKFLHDILNQTHRCSACGEPREAHVYTYVNRCGILTVRVKKLPVESQLPGEAEGKLWMWAQCSQCEQMKMNQKSKRRVVMSAAARSLSFGKFLELSFSVYSTNGVFSCHHSLQKDYRRFFGLGPMVTMFTYSPINIYRTCMPPAVLEFYSPVGQANIEKEAERVLKKGRLLFTEVTKYLQYMKSDRRISISDPKEFSLVMGMVRQEESDFEARFENITYKSKLQGQSVLLRLNSLIRELILQSYVWDRRLQSLQSSYFGEVITDGTQKTMLEDAHLLRQKDDIQDQSIEGRANTSEIFTNEISTILIDRSQSDTSLSSSTCGNVMNHDNKPGTELEIKLDGISIDEVEHSTEEFQVSEPSHMKSAIKSCHLDAGKFEEPLQMENTIPIIEEQLRDTDSVDDFDKHVSGFSGTSSMVSLKGNIWSSFQEIHKAYKMDFQGGYAQKFGVVDSYTTQFLSPATQLITEKGCRLHIPLGGDDSVVSSYESEPTSLIACALALLQENLVEKVVRKEKGGFKRATEYASYADSDVSVASSSYWSSNGSLDSEGSHAEESVSSEESYSSFFDASLLVEHNLEIHLGVKRPPEKEKYSVICMYEKQFHALRRDCCPSERDYISSLSRCKQWDAKGGKSGSLFVKTLDDRFIVKQIQKTEYESFLKFGLKYFDHIKQSLSSGSQTCLSKILGIYQVTIRESKNGRDLKYHLMVMENLLFGKNVARLYDLKGLLYHRHISESDGVENVFLDGNFVEDMNFSPLYVGGKTKRLLERAIWNDTSFLTSINVMDYSLLVGVDTQRHELVCGIIDYLRQYTWDKQLETFTKVSLVVPKNETPTVVPPVDYKKRFRKFIHRQLLSVPDYSCPEVCVQPPQQK